MSLSQFVDCRQRLSHSCAVISKSNLQFPQRRISGVSVFRIGQLGRNELDFAVQILHTKVLRRESCQQDRSFLLQFIQRFAKCVKEPSTKLVRIPLALKARLGC